MKNLIEMGLIILSLFLLIWVQTGFFIQARKSKLTTHLFRMSCLLCLWMLLRSAEAIAPTDVLHWIFTAFAFVSFCLACHEWNHVSYRLGLRQDPPQNMLAASLAMMILFSILIAGNPWHGLIFHIYTRADTKPGPLYFIICGALIAMFFSSSLSIGRLLVRNIRHRPRFLVFLACQIFSCLLFLILFILDLVHLEVSLLSSLPGNYITNMIVLMFFLKQSDAAQVFALPAPNWSPNVLKAMDEAILTFNEHGRVLTWNSVMPDLADGVSSFTEWLVRLRASEVDEVFTKAAEQAWANEAETSSGVFFLVQPRRRITWQLWHRKEITCSFSEKKGWSDRCFLKFIEQVISFQALYAAKKSYACNGGHLLFLKDTTQSWMLEEESVSLQRQLATLQQAVDSYGEIERQAAMEREIALSLDVLRSNLRVGLQRIDEDLSTASQGDLDPASGSIRFQDMFLQIRKILLTLRRGLHDLILMDHKTS